MPDPFAKVSPGDPVTFSATTWNAMLEAGQDYRKRKDGIRSDPLTTSRSSTIIRVKNSSGKALNRGEILGLGDPIFTPENSSLDAFLREITFRGFTPDIKHHKRKYCVLLEPAPVDRVVRAILAGLCHVLVDQRDETHEYAGIVDHSTLSLRSSVHGHARILWREGLEDPGDAYGYGSGGGYGGYGYGGYGYYDAGIQWAIVMLGVTGSSDSIGKASGAISARSGSTYGTGKVDLYRSDNGHEDGPIETIDVLNASADEAGYVGSIESGLYVSVAWDWEDNAWVAPLECSPGDSYYA